MSKSEATRGTHDGDDHVARVAALFERVAPDYDVHVPFFTAFAAKLVGWADITAGEHVLDIGTGRGAVARATRARGASGIGLDISFEMLRHGDGDRVRADARALPVRGEAFDVAVGAFSIHLLPDPVAGLREAARTVRHGGRVVLAHGGRFASADWDFWFETLARHAHRGTHEPTLPGPTPIPDVVAAFEAAGLIDVRTEEVEVAVEVDDPVAFLRGEQAHGSRSFFDRFDDDVRAEVERDLLAGLESLHAAGNMTLRRASWFTEGRRATQPRPA